MTPRTRGAGHRDERRLGRIRRAQRQLAGGSVILLARSPEHVERLRSDAQRDESGGALVDRRLT